MSDSTPEKLLVDYYAQTADQYDQWHLNGSEHNVALTLVSALISELKIESVLDVAGGTGRGWLFLKSRHPHLQVRTNDLSKSLLRKATANGVPSACAEVASTYALPYADAAFDLVMEFGALHHMARPEAAVDEMLRVSRLGVALHDSNMYVTGFGRLTLLRNSLLGSLVKLIMTESGILRAAKRFAYGREYSVTAGDGVFYTTYSVFQSVRRLRQQCKRLFVIPTQGSRYKDSLPLLGASHCLVIALKDELI